MSTMNLNLTRHCGIQLDQGTQLSWVHVRLSSLLTFVFYGNFTQVMHQNTLKYCPSNIERCRNNEQMAHIFTFTEA